MNSEFDQRVQQEKDRLLNPPLITILSDEELHKRGTSKLLFILRKLTPIVRSLENPWNGQCECGDHGCEYHFEEQRPARIAAEQVAPIYEAYRQRIKAVLAERPHIPRLNKRERKNG